MKALTSFVMALVLTLALTFTLYTYNAQQVLEAETTLQFTQSRQYTDNRVLDSQSQILSVVGEVSRTTRLLALIICQRESDRTLCNDPTNQQGEPE